MTIQTNDLDPMYSVIHGLHKNKDEDWMGRFLMYFLLFYDAGGATYAADRLNTRNYWDEILRASQTKEIRRGTERRHFRGVNALRAVTNLRDKHLSPWGTLMDMYGEYGGRGVNYTQFYKRMSEDYAGTQFGPYFIWKLYDIFNVCLEMPISMTMQEALKFMPAEPIAVLNQFSVRWGLSLNRTLDRFALEIGRHDHPVVPGRKCGYAEVETVLCMIKGAFLTRTHRIGDDIDEKRKQLEGYSELLGYLPRPVSPHTYQVGTLKEWVDDSHMSEADYQTWGRL